MLKETSASADDGPAPALSDGFCEALTWGLRHNVFLLDAILEELLDRLVQSEDHPASYKAALVRDLRSRWTAAVIGGERAEELERTERELDRSRLLQKVTCAEQLNRWASRLRAATVTAGT